ncbi:hypothetical protein OROGR_020287 [Orobanche gracilis]
MVVRRDWSRVDADDDRDFLGWNGFSAIWVSSPGSNLSTANSTVSSPD